MTDRNKTAWQLRQVRNHIVTAHNLLVMPDVKEAFATDIVGEWNTAKCLEALAEALHAVEMTLHSMGIEVEK